MYLKITLLEQILSEHREIIRWQEIPTRTWYMASGTGQGVRSKYGILLMTTLDQRNRNTLNTLDTSF